MSKRAACLTCAILAFFLVVSLCVHAAHPGRNEEVAKLEELYLRPTLLENLRCIQLIRPINGWIEARYLGGRSCDRARRTNPVLDAMAFRGTWWLRVVKRGKHVLFGSSVVVGPAPSYSPGWTLCLAECWTLLLDPMEAGLGYLPKELFANASTPQRVSTGQIWSHESGHGYGDVHLLQSKTRAVESENWFRLAIEHSDVPRFLHDPPARIAAPAKTKQK